MADSPAHPDSTATPLRILIVDDEPLARLRLRQLVSEVTEPGTEVVGEAGDAAQALAWLRHRCCDLILLDIQMPGADGMAFAAELQRLQSGPDLPIIIFVTAHPQHALKAFELAALDYLTKPVRRERLQAALLRAAQRRGANPVPAAAMVPVAEPPVIVVTERGRVLRIPLAEVLYLKAEQKYVTLRTAARSHLLDEPLAELEQRLGERFLRVHRNALVARAAVRALERRVLPGSAEQDGGESWAVRVDGVDEWLAVSRRQVSAVRDALLAAGL